MTTTFCQFFRAPAFSTVSVASGDVDDNPFLILKAPKPSPAREKVLSNDEIRAFWHVDTHRVYIPMLRFTLLTGQRFNNVRHLRWSQINREQMATDFTRSDEQIHSDDVGGL